MSGHTPGPWAITGDPDHFAGLKIEAAKEGIIHWVIAERIGGQITGDDFDNYSVVEANARLVAAAPDFLEALEALTDMGLFHDGKGTRTFVPATVEQYDAAIAAIAKAKGEQP